MKVRMMERTMLGNRRLSRCSVLANLVYVRLILAADDCGRFYGTADRILPAIFPLMRTVTEADVERAICELAEEALIEIYEVEGERYLLIPGWEAHQRLRYKTPLYPAPVVTEEQTDGEQTDGAPIYNNIISISKEDETRREETRRDETRRDEKENLSLNPPQSPPCSLPSTTSGQARGGEGQERERDLESVGKGTPAAAVITAEAEPPSAPLGAVPAERVPSASVSAEQGSAQFVPAESAPVERAPDALLASRFERFWAAYPRHDKKHEARRVYQGVARSGVSEEALLSSVARFRETEQWNRDGGRYIPTAVAWLRERRWEDEVPPPHTPTVSTGGGWAPAQEGSFDTDDFFAAALARPFRTRRDD